MLEEIEEHGDIGLMISHEMWNKQQTLIDNLNDRLQILEDHHNFIRMSALELPSKVSNALRQSRDCLQPLRDFAETIRLPADIIEVDVEVEEA